MKITKSIYAFVLAAITFLITAPIKVFAGAAANDAFQGFEQVDQALLDQANPLVNFSTRQAQLSTPGGIITEILDFAFPIAGLILFVMITWGGFEMLSEAATKKSIDAGRNRVQAAIIGFIILFVSYWIVRVLEYLFNVNIVSY